MKIIAWPESESTILYRGERIKVEVITELNTKYGEGYDFILRDEAGRYYFRRETYNAACGYRIAQREPEKYGYRCQVHRISLAAVILFQVDFAAKRILRQETSALLAALRGREAA